eukprot:scaffold703_cov156-Skeletonema_menzelii.AAC.2
MIRDNVAGKWKSLARVVDVMKLDIMLLTSLSRERESGARVVTSNTKETTIATAATFIDTNGSDSGGGIHRKGEEVIPRVQTTHITVHNNNKDVTDKKKKKLLLNIHRPIDRAANNRGKK